MDASTRKIYLILLIGLVQLTAFGSDKLIFNSLDYKNGLSHNHIYCFAQDNNGFIWIGTRSGLNRYDGYNFKVFKHEQDDSTSIPGNVVQTIVKDQLGRFWIQVPTYLYIFNPDNEECINHFSLTADKKVYQNFNMDMIVPYGDSLVFIRIQGEGILKHNIYTNQNKLLASQKGTKSPLIDLAISNITSDKKNLYVTYENGIVDIINPNTLKLVKRINDIAERVKIKGKLFESFVRKNGEIWVFCNDEALGVFVIEPSGSIKYYNTNSSPALNSNNVSCIVEAPDGNIWIGTDHGGINIFSSNKQSIDYVTNNTFTESGLKQNVITELFVSKENIVWIGTFKQGINYYNKNIYRFHHYVSFPNNSKSLPYNDVNCFAEDHLGNIWIGTNGDGLVYYDRKNESFLTFKADPNKANALHSGVIVDLFVDRAGKLWIATYHGGLSYYDGKSFRNFLHDPSNLFSISGNMVWDVFEDSQGAIWVGMLGGGLDRLDKKTGKFFHYNGNGMNAINSNFVMDITEDNEGNMWFGSDRGVFVLDQQTRNMIVYQNKPSQTNSLSDNFVYNVFKDSKGRIWAGTRNGLNLFNRGTNTFVPIKIDANLGDNAILSILEERNGTLWLGTSSGLVKLVLKFNNNEEIIEHYTVLFTESDGLQSKEFNEGSALRTNAGELIFGGPNGFNLFLPEKNLKLKGETRPYITGLELFGKPILVGKEINNRVLLTSATLNNAKITLKPDENMFSLTFGLLDYLTPKRIHYRYKLEGFNHQWIYTTWQDRKATFTNLSPGTYRFVVQCTDFITPWEKTEATVSIAILPPWYRAWYAYLVYLFILIMITIASRNFIIMRIRNKFLKSQAEEEAIRQYELNQLKTRFFTNVSHEFRTPLTLILTPLDSLLKKELDPGTRKHLQLIRQNAKRLLFLVNQLLDFRKVEANKLSPDLTYGNIINHLRRTVESFHELAEPKKIDLQFVSYESELFMRLDTDKTEKIINNLLSNAFKFTPEGGSIHVIVQLIDEDETEMLRIKVQDMGIGIDKEHREKLFERFYQVHQPREFVTTGSGIGLSLTKEFVELLGGSISVESEPGQGSCFTVKLPVNRNRIINSIEDPEFEEDIERQTPDITIDKTKQTLLLVEDNQEFRNYLRDSLSDRFNILEAENGQEALNILENQDPDLVISDIMMPIMDGYQLCKQIKTNPEYSHVPIILLTAKSTHEDKVAGFRVGADEYITKPFNLDILESRIDYLLKQRQQFIKDYQKSLKITTNNEAITTLDQKLLERIREHINKNISNPDLTVNMLSKEIGVSRVHLYKKTMSLTGKTPIELIRLIRLKKASELLSIGRLTISEISYEVGFNDPRYFSKIFKNEFGMLPSKYKDNQENI